MEIEKDVETAPPTQPVDPPARKYPAPALEKGLDILEFLAAAVSPCSQAEIASGLDRTVNEIFRMLTTLEDRHYIVRDATSGLYTLSLRMFELSRSHPPISQILEVARHPMLELAHSLGQSVHLSVLDQHSQVVLAHEESPSYIALTVKAGSRQPAVRTTSGRLLLSQMQPQNLKLFLDKDLDFRTFTMKEKAHFFTSLESARTNRYLMDSSAMVAGVVDISTLIGGGKAGIVATLAAPVLEPAVGTADHDRIKRELVLAANHIAREAGLLLEQG